MPLTLRSLAEDPALRLNVLVPGPPGALDRPVAWVHNTELPDPSPYLRATEVVLTNGLWRDDGTGAEEFVANVVRAQAAGIVFGLRDPVPTTPPVLTEACRRHRLPLLELAIEVPFTALSHAAAATHERERHALLEASLRRGTELAEVISSGTGLPGALRRLHAELRLPLAIVDRLGRPLAQEGTRLPGQDLRRIGDALTHRPPPLDVPAGPSAAALFPIGVPGEITTALVCLRPAAALTETELGALQQTAHILSMEIARQREIEATRMQFAGELIDMITSGVGEQTALAHRLQALGIDPTAPLAVTALAHATGGAPVTTALTDAARAAHLACGIPALLIPTSRDIVALTVWQRPAHEIAPWLHRLTADLEDRFPGRRTVAGHSGPADGYTRLRAPLRQARQACQALTRQPAGPPIATLTELPTHLTLLTTLTPADLRAFADAVLAPLRAHDAARATRLEQTLRTLFDHQARLKDTADTLHIHINTLHKRLKAISTVTGRDPTTFHGRVDLFLALQADALVTP